MKVVTIIGTRPELIRLSSIIKQLEIDFNHSLIHTGQNYDFELSEIFFKDFQIKSPDFYLNCNGKNLGETIGNIINKTYSTLREIKPDAVLILGDTNSCLSAYSAKRLKIPIFHLEAGNRCFDQNVPEEINRKIVDHISDVNLCYSKIAREYLIQEGFPANQIITVGSPIREVWNNNREFIENRKAYEKFNLQKNSYFLCSLHREENVDQECNLLMLIEALNKIITRFSLPIIFPCHPRTKKHIESILPTINKKVILVKPIGYLDYISLQKNSFCVLSDSGTITEESSIIEFPAVNIRSCHERPEGMEEAAVIMSGLSQDNIIESIELTIRHHRDRIKSYYEIYDYKSDNVSFKVSRIIKSYVPFINRYVWKQPNYLQ